MGKALRLAYRTSVGFDRSFNRQTQYFHDAYPTLNVERRDFDLPALHDRMVAGSGCVSGEWDLFLCSSDWLPRLIEEERLLPLSDFLEASPPDDWPSDWSPSMRGIQTNQQGLIFGLPYHDGPEIFMYRADLFESPAEGKAFEAAYGYALTPPETWAQFLDIARFFTRPQRNLYGCVLAGNPDCHNSVYDFLIQLWSRGGRLLDGRRAAFDSPEGRDALQFLTDLINREAVTQPDPRAYESVKSGECYASGAAAMMWNWCGFAVVADMPPSRIIGKSKFGLIPRGEGPAGRHVSLNSYWVLTIPRGCRNPNAAWSFLRSTASADMDRITSVEGGIGCRLSTWRDARLQQTFRCYAHIEETHKSIEVLPAIPQVDKLIQVLNWSIDEVHLRKTTVDRAITRAAREIDTLLKL